MNSVSPFRDLNKYPNLNFELEEEGSSSCLFHAVREGKIDVVRTMLRTELYPPYEKLIEAAMDAGQREIIELLLIEENSDTNTPTHHHRLILKAAKDEDSRLLMLLLNDLSPDDIAYSLQAVINSGNLSSLRAFLAAKVNPNVADGIALLQAVKSKHHEMLCMLIAHGADVNSTYGKAALSIAVTEEYSKMVNVLLNAGANVQDPQNTILLDVFSNRQYFLNRNVDLKILDALLEKKANLQAVNEAGDTPLHLTARIATITGNIKPFEKLWRAGAALYIKNKKEQTPLTILDKARSITRDRLQEIGLDLLTILGEQSSSSSRSNLEAFEMADAPLSPDETEACLDQLQNVSIQSFFPTREEMINAVKEDDLTKIKHWIDEEKFNSDFNLGLAVIESIKEDNFEIFEALINQSQQPLWVEHRREAIRVAAAKNLRHYITSLLPIDSKKAAEFRGAALLAAAKAGHRDLAADMANGASDRSLIPALEKALQEDHLEIAKDLLACISGTLARISERIGQISHLLSTEAEVKDLIKTKESIHTALGSILKESAERGLLEIVHLILQTTEKNAISSLDKRLAIIRAKPYGFSEIIEQLENSR